MNSDQSSPRLGFTDGSVRIRVGDHAARCPDKAAGIDASTGHLRTFAELEDRSARLARFLADAGLEQQSHLAVLLPNGLEYLDAAWAARRSGLYMTPVNWHLTAAEASYIVNDCGASALITSPELSHLVAPADASLKSPGVRLVSGGSLEDAVASSAPDPVRPEIEGSFMFYSSGTTGRPKGILRPWTPQPYGTGRPLEALMAGMFGFGEDTVYLCPAPLYHAAPIAWSMGTQGLGGTVIIMDRFDASEALRLIERYRVTHVQVVPTMFVRLLKLSDSQRSRYDISSLQTVIHAAAPCPIEVKRQMLDWWGPIIHEYYAASEGCGMTLIGPEDWLTHPGSVGRAASGVAHILDDEGNELPPYEVGTIWFEGTGGFRYHNDPIKTAAAYNDRRWATLGDMGSLDRDGYLYLSDRRTNLILSGGVNIYPQEIENALTLHPAVLDVAVIGVPDAEMGQQVKAVVQPADPSSAGPDLERELIAFCRGRLAGFKCPRTVDFVDELPRLPSGKMAKRLLIDRFSP